jgi:mycothiol S-conjugate amidase
LVIRRACLLSVHAHPDDESSKSAGAVARYAAEGVRCVLVSCTGGEAGDNRLGAETGDVAAVRAAELRNAVRILGYEATHLLGAGRVRHDGLPRDRVSTGLRVSP